MAIFSLVAFKFIIFVSPLVTYIYLSFLHCIVVDQTTFAVRLDDVKLWQFVAFQVFLFLENEQVIQEFIEQLTFLDAQRWIVVPLVGENVVPKIIWRTIPGNDFRGHNDDI